MKMRSVFFIALAMLFASSAYAGFVQPAPVNVDTVNRIATGDMATARFADNEDEFIGCGMRFISDGAGGVIAWGFCQARQEGGESLTCFTQDAALIDAMKATSDYSYISFSWDEEEECTRIGFSTQSFYIPKHWKKQN